MRDSITKSYKKTNTGAINNINKQANENFCLDDRIEQFDPREFFATLKDHKETFQNSPKCRLLNPAKSEIVIISNHYIEKINSNLRKITNMNQWRNTQADPLDETYNYLTNRFQTRASTRRACRSDAATFE